MTFIPNVSAATYPHQARPLSSDYEILAASAGGWNGVVSGCAVTESGSPGMTVDVASGVVKIAGVSITVTGDTLLITTADVSSPRWDLVVVDDAAVLSVEDGTPGTSPVTPAIPVDSVVLAAVYVPASDTSITDPQIVDKRIFVQPALGASQWTTIPCAADLTRSNTATLAADTVLAFTMASSMKYRIRVVAFFTQLAASDLKYGFSGPASPTLVRVRHHATWDLGTPSTPFASFGMVSAYETSGIALSSTGGREVILELDAIIHNGSNTGDFALTWAQNTAVAENTTRRAGSYLEYEVA